MLSFRQQTFMSTSLELEMVASLLGVVGKFFKQKIDSSFRLATQCKTVQWIV